MTKALFKQFKYPRDVEISWLKRKMPYVFYIEYYHRFLNCTFFAFKYDVSDCGSAAEIAFAEEDLDSVIEHVIEAETRYLQYEIQEFSLDYIEPITFNELYKKLKVDPNCEILDTSE